MLILAHRELRARIEDRMPRRTPTEKLDEIERVLRAHPDGMGAHEIAQALSERTSDRTLQNHLSRLAKDGRVLRLSSGRWARYRIPAATDAGTAEGPAIRLSDQAAEIQHLLRRPLAARAAHRRGGDRRGCPHPSDQGWRPPAVAAAGPGAARRDPGAAARRAGVTAAAAVQRSAARMAASPSR